MFKYLRALGYLLTFRINKATRTLMESNPGIMAEEFKSVIKQKAEQANVMMDAVASLVKIQEEKKQTAERLAKEIKDVSELKEGAAAMAQEVVRRHNGNQEQVKADPEYQECYTAFEDFSSTLTEKEARFNEVQADIKNSADRVEAQKNALRSVHRELDKLRARSHEAVAEMISAQQEQRMNQMLSGIGEDKTTDRLRELEDIVSQAKAKAKVGAELAGTNTKIQEEKFKKAVRERNASSEFDKLIGLAKEKDAVGAGAAPDTKLPE